MDVARAVPGLSCSGSLWKIAVQLRGDLRRYCAVSVQHKPRLQLPKCFLYSLCAMRLGCLTRTFQQGFGRGDRVFGALRSCWRRHSELSGTGGDTAVPSWAAQPALRPLQPRGPGCRHGQPHIFWDNIFRCVACHHCNFRVQSIE